VTCARGGTLPNSIWYIEQNSHPTIPETSEAANYRVPSFFEKFWELNAVMWRTNAGLIESHAWDSRPGDWPWLRRGINFWYFATQSLFILGDEIIDRSISLGIQRFGGHRLLQSRSTSSSKESVCSAGNEAIKITTTVLPWSIKLTSATWSRYDWAVGVTVLGWGLHYLPFFLMKRQLFLHHYFPALYFAVMALCQGWDYLTTRQRFKVAPRRASQITFVFLAVVIGVYVALQPLAYGGPWTKSMCEKSRVFSTWDFDCNAFYEDVSPPFRPSDA
jgi:dolichyl-phosphate-mannose-protein mannosyltransferase